MKNSSHTLLTKKQVKSLIREVVAEMKRNKSPKMARPYTYEAPKGPMGEEAVIPPTTNVEEEITADSVSEPDQLNDTKLNPSSARKKRLKELTGFFREKIKMDENGRWVRR